MALISFQAKNKLLKPAYIRYLERLKRLRNIPWPFILLIPELEREGLFLLVIIDGRLDGAIVMHDFDLSEVRGLKDTLRIF